MLGVTSRQLMFQIAFRCVRDASKRVFQARYALILFRLMRHKRWQYNTTDIKLQKLKSKRLLSKKESRPLDQKTLKEPVTLIQKVTRKARVDSRNVRVNSQKDRGKLQEVCAKSRNLNRFVSSTRNGLHRSSRKRENYVFAARRLRIVDCARFTRWFASRCS